MVVPKDVLEGARCFNAGDYFDAHEVWEDHWGHGRADERELTLGLIKAAVALHHLSSGNEAGFQWQAKEAVPRLLAHHALWPELKLDELAEAIDSLAAQARFHRGIPDAWDRPQLPLP